MLYDIRLKLDYEYPSPVAGGRHLIRVMPLDLPGAQRVIAARVALDPVPEERRDWVDFFGNRVTTALFREAHDHLFISLSARVQVTKAARVLDMSPDIATLGQEIEASLELDALSPQHYLSASPRIALEPDITEYAAASLKPGITVWALADDLCRRIHDDFEYDPEATDVGTSPREAFGLKRGVCQDFSHVMIAGLRGVGVPAGYVSGFLRTIPPPGTERLEGADAMHAWVRVWCGRDIGWCEFDPTNACTAGDDHITVGYGRDYSDISPIVGVLKGFGSHGSSHSVDVIPIEEKVRA